MRARDGMPWLLYLAAAALCIVGLFVSVEANAANRFEQMSELKRCEWRSHLAYIMANALSVGFPREKLNFSVFEVVTPEENDYMEAAQKEVYAAVDRIGQPTKDADKPKRDAFVLAVVVDIRNTCLQAIGKARLKQAKSEYMSDPGRYLQSGSGPKNHHGDPAAEFCDEQMGQIGYFSGKEQALAMFEEWVAMGQDLATESWFTDMVRHLIAVYFSDGRDAAHAVCMLVLSESET